MWSSLRRRRKSDRTSQQQRKEEKGGKKETRACIHCLSLQQNHFSTLRTRHLHRLPQRMPHQVLVFKALNRKQRKSRCNLFWNSTSGLRSRSTEKKASNNLACKRESSKVQDDAAHDRGAPLQDDDEARRPPTLDGSSRAIGLLK